jgi:hypothetical protein
VQPSVQLGAGSLEMAQLGWNDVFGSS